MHDLFEYEDFRAYVTDWLAEERGRSLRKLSRVIGVAPSTASQVFKVDSATPRRLPARATAPLCEALGLDDQESRYLLALVEKEQATDPTERDAAADRAAAIRRFQFSKGLTVRQYELFAEWHHGAIAELAHCAGFRADPDWISQTLVPPITPAQAKDSLQLLVELGLLVETEGGQLAPASAMVVDNQWGTASARSEAMRTQHLRALGRAAEVIDEMPSDERLLISAVVAVASDDLERVRARALAAVQDALQIGNGGGSDRDQVVQVMLQIFPLSRRTTGPPG